MLNRFEERRPEFLRPVRARASAETRRGGLGWVVNLVAAIVVLVVCVIGFGFWVHVMWNLARVGWRILG